MKTSLKLNIIVDLCKVVYYVDVWFSSQTLKQELAQAHKENLQLKSKSQKAEAELKILTETVHR